MNIRTVTPSDISPLVDLYNDYIRRTTITFELSPIDGAEMQQRVTAKLAHHDWLVAEVDGQVVGYAYYGAFHSRAAYRHTVEVSIYLAPAHQGKGYGKALYRALLASAQAKGFREAIALIALPNPASIALHHKLGFEETGVLRQVGYKLDRYIDVSFWQKSL